MSAEKSKYPKYVWFDGKLVNWKDAKIHIMTHALHYGTGCFEGIRAYKTHNGKTAIFRLREHIERLINSWHIFGFRIPYSLETIMNACKETVRKNRLKECYIRPIVFINEIKLGLSPFNCKQSLAIIAMPFGRYLGKDALKKGIKAMISSYWRYPTNAMLTKAKFTGEYIMSAVAKKQAEMLGFQEAIMLDANGFVSEGTGENIFIVRNNELVTPPKTTILEGITRDSIMKIAKHLGIECKEDFITRDQLYVADEVFLCGTAAEITPVVEIDGRKIGNGKPGKITRKLQEEFFAIVKGLNAEFKHWLYYV